ncbi:MAG: FAD-dependent oxidoreductase [Magnetococcus sp. THC-1_WYH]
MDIGIVGGDINGLWRAWQVAKQGHQVQIYERDTVMGATSRALSKRRHGGLRHLENRENPSHAVKRNKAICAMLGRTTLLDTQPKVISTFAGLRPLLRGAQDPSKATREYVIHRMDKLVTVLGGKWITALALTDKVATVLQRL